MRIAFDRNRSLQELDGVDWGEPTYASYLVTTCHRLRRMPLAEFETEDLRVMIGQGIGLTYLVPLAVERLAEDPLESGDYYEGDLLYSVLTVGINFWQAWPDLRSEVELIVGRLETTQKTIESQVVAAINDFRQAAGDGAGLTMR